MQEFISRMITEYDELKERINHAETALCTLRLDGYETSMLRRQIALMKRYVDILHKRICYELDKEKNEPSKI